jgi:glycosyltransferase involved in cell wall biosynthesis
VAAYAVSGVPEVVLDRSTGRLVAPNDVNALVRQASALLTDDSTRRAMGEAARERYRALFDIRAIAPRYLDLYEQVVSLR